MLLFVPMHFRCPYIVRAVEYRGYVINVNRYVIMKWGLFNASMLRCYFKALASERFYTRQYNMINLDNCMNITKQFVLANKIIDNQFISYNKADIVNYNRYYQII